RRTERYLRRRGRRPGWNWIFGKRFVISSMIFGPPFGPGVPCARTVYVGRPFAAVALSLPPVVITDLGAERRRAGAGSRLSGVSVFGMLPAAAVSARHRLRLGSQPGAHTFDFVEDCRPDLRDWRTGALLSPDL